MIDVLAHQGGWDETLYLVIPVGLAIAGVRWVERRNRAQGGDAQEVQDGPPPAGDQHGDG